MRRTASLDAAQRSAIGEPFDRDTPDIVHLPFHRHSDQLPLHDVVLPMSNRSTLTELAAGAFASGPRSRSGHRYRDDDQPFMPAATPLPPSTNHHAAPATAGFGTHAAGNTAWDETAAWSQSGGAWNEDAWSEGSAWHEGQDGVSAASEAPEASAWEQDSNAAWDYFFCRRADGGV